MRSPLSRASGLTARACAVVLGLNLIQGSSAMTDAASATVSSIAAARDARGRFQPGSSGNPAGKRPGTLNRATVLKRIMAEGDEERIASLIVERALKGEWGALRFVQDRLEPKPRARPITLDFPETATVAEMSEIVLR